MRKRQHRFDEWAGKANSDEFVFNFNLDISPIFQKDWKREFQETRHDVLHIRKSVKMMYIHNLDNQICILIDLNECDSILLAHEAIIDDMAQCTIPKFPTGKELGLYHGDINFGMWGGLWARFNIEFFVHNACEHPIAEKDFQKINEKLDILICELTIPKTVLPINVFLEPSEIILGEKSRISIPFKKDDLDFTQLSGKIAARGGEILRDGTNFYFQSNRLGTHKIRVKLITNEGECYYAEAEIKVKNRK